MNDAKLEKAYDTKILYTNPDESAQISSAERISPHLFVCCGSEIEEYRLSGTQTVGRPVPGEEPQPDIPIANPHVSRRHGTFETLSDRTMYIADQTVNGVRRDGIDLWPGGSTYLRDGDELVIPAAEPGSGANIILVYVDTYERLEIWRGLKRAAGNKEEAP